MKNPASLSIFAAVFTTLSLATAASIFEPSNSIADVHATPIETPRFGDRAVTGALHAWRIEEDGTLLVALMPENQQAVIWFRTPANQSSTTQFELLALHAVLAMDHPDRKNHKLRIRGESTTELDGDDAKHAIRLVSIGRGA